MQVHVKIDKYLNNHILKYIPSEISAVLVKSDILATGESSLSISLLNSNALLIVGNVMLVGGVLSSVTITHSLLVIVLLISKKINLFNRYFRKL